MQQCTLGEASQVLGVHHPTQGMCTSIDGEPRLQGIPWVVHTSLTWRTQTSLAYAVFVRVLQVKAGQAAPAELQREQEKLGQMDSQLQGLQSNYTKMRDQAAALLHRMSSSSSAADAAGAGGSAKSDPVASGFSSAMYAGLKFSGLAMRVAADVVSSVTDDAGKMLRVSIYALIDLLPGHSAGRAALRTMTRWVGPAGQHL